MPKPTQETGERCRPRTTPIGWRVFLSWMKWAMGVAVTAPAIGEAPAPPEVSRASGYFSQPFALEIRLARLGTAAQSSLPWRLIYTTNGTSPSLESGLEWRGDLMISNTLCLRVAAVNALGERSRVETRSYFFLPGIARQTGDGFPKTWGSQSNQPIAADYEMDPELLGTEAQRDELTRALTALPVVSMVAPLDSWFDPKHGIYSNPRESGEAWEREGSVEWLGFRSGTDRVESAAGIRIQGGWNRRPEESPKHAFRLSFRKRYGVAKLKHSGLFREAGPTEFDSLILRAGCNNTWLHWDGMERRRGDYLRDQWVRDTYREMGHASARGRFVHLFLNGLYWGIYNLAERPDESFARAHWGGSDDDWDVRNGNNVLAGSGVAWDLWLETLRSGTPRALSFEWNSEQADLAGFADYLLLNLYGANGDWDGSSNWYAGRRRNPAGPWRFFVWDAERTLEQVNDNRIQEVDADSPKFVFHRLLAIPQFRTLFAARARQHLDGVLSPESARNRYQRLVEGLDPAMPAEAARWGDYRRDFHRYRTPPYELYTRETHWRVEVRRLLDEYFPRRSEVFERQLIEFGIPVPPR